MNKKVEHIGKQYTSQVFKKNQRQKMIMRVVRRRIALFGG
nr:septum formation initiator family protein [Streptococcus vestibularis]